MGGEQASVSGPDLAAGIEIGAVPDGGMLAGHVGDDAVLVVRQGEEVFAVGATCTHYGGPLGEGVVVGDSVRCPWHHACFSLRTGEAVRAPALNPVACWNVEREGDRVIVRSKRDTAADGATPVHSRARVAGPESVVVVGAGAAGNAAAEMLRRQGYEGPVTMIGAEDSVPYDRPNLSKDYLAGSAPEEWIPLRPREFYRDHDITLLSGVRVTEIDVRGHRVRLDDGSSRRFDRLLLATGAEPVRLQIPGADLAHVRYLRSLADSRAIIGMAATAKRALVVGASFIGLEVAASLRKRGLEVRVVAPESRPLERVLGPEIGALIRRIHEEQGVTFHLGRTAARIDPGQVTLDDGSVHAADLVVAGIGVRPLIALAEAAGLAIDRGVAVDEYLETSAPGIYAAGDIARWPDRHTGERVRVEHWVVAERQGQTAARNMLASARGGEREAFDDVPFFWSNHYDAVINYVGHAQRWDRIDIDGDIDARDFAARFVAGGRVLAVATMGRDVANLRAEVELERGRWATAGTGNLTETRA